MTTVTRNDDSQNICTVPVGRCNQHTSVEESKHEEKRKNSKKKMRLYIVPGEPNLFYQQGNKNSYILSISVSLIGSPRNERST